MKDMRLTYGLYMDIRVGLCIVSIDYEDFV